MSAPSEEPKSADSVAELISATANKRWQARYKALEAARELPRDMRRRVAKAFIDDENSWVRGLANFLAGEERHMARTSRRAIVHDFDQVVRGARLNLDQRTRLIKLLENAEESGSFAYLALAADRAARLVTGSLSATGSERDDYLHELERFLKHVGAYAEPSRVSELPETTSAIVAGCAGRSQTHVVVEQSVDMRINREAAVRALEELFANAHDAHASQISLSIMRQDGHASIKIANNGQGIDHVVADRLFEPWFTTRPGRAGLGLFLAREAIKEAGGRIEPLDITRSEFEITLPEMS